MQLELWELESEHIQEQINRLQKEFNAQLKTLQKRKQQALRREEVEQFGFKVGSILSVPPQTLKEWRERARYSAEGHPGGEVGNMLRVREFHMSGVQSSIFYYSNKPTISLEDPDNGYVVFVTIAEARTWKVVKI